MVENRKILVVTSNLEPNNVKAEKSYKHTNKPFTRHHRIYQLLKFHGYPIVIVDRDVPLMEGAIFSLIEHDPNYVHFLKSAYQSWVSSGYDGDHMFQTKGLITYHFNKTLELDPQVIATIPFYRQTGIWGSDYLTPIYEHTYNTSIQTAYNGIHAVTKLQDNDIVYLLNIFPGHHATTCTYGGYCFLNNGAISAVSLLKEHKKIAILDLDYHHGDGTQKIFYDFNSVLTVSIHVDPSLDYPTFTGFEEENTRTNINFPLKPPVKLQWYLEILQKAMDKITSFDAQVLVIAFGADTYHDDPDANERCRFGLKITDYRRIGELIAKNFSGKTVVTQEGGYAMKHVAEIVDNFLSGLSKR